MKLESEPRARGRPRSFDREAALDAAMMLFWRQGFEGTSLFDLTAAMGIRPASLYAAFGSKEALFREALTRYRSGVGSGLPRILNGAATGRAAIRLLLEGAAATVTRRSQPRGCMIVLSALHGFAEMGDLDRELQRCRAEDKEMILERLKKSVADGELPSGSDPVAMAAFYMAILQGMSVQARDGATRAALMAIADQAMQAWPSARGSIEDTGATRPQVKLQRNSAL
jgi:AcrR family transcriptional regulator